MFIRLYMCGIILLVAMRWLLILIWRACGSIRRYVFRNHIGLRNTSSYLILIIRSYLAKAKPYFVLHPTNIIDISILPKLTTVSCSSWNIASKLMRNCRLDNRKWDDTSRQKSEHLWIMHFVYFMHVYYVMLLLLLIDWLAIFKCTIRTTQSGWPGGQLIEVNRVV